MTGANFATSKDFERRFGIRVEADALLLDASALLRSEFFLCHKQEYRRGLNALFDENAPAVCCFITKRLLDAQKADGVSSLTQTVGDFSEAVVYGQTIEKAMRLTLDERRMLGLSVSSCYSICANSCGGKDDAWQ